MFSHLQIIPVTYISISSVILKINYMKFKKVKHSIVFLENISFKNKISCTYEIFFIKNGTFSILTIIHHLKILSR